MRVLGHTSEVMSINNYYHVDDIAMKKIRIIQEEIV
jgi:hypothetical protein